MGGAAAGGGAFPNLEEDDLVLVVIVMERTGTPFFLVRRREAEMLPWADLRARWRGWRESSRLMVLEGSADWMVQFSKRKSIGSVLFSRH